MFIGFLVPLLNKKKAITHFPLPIYFSPTQIHINFFDKSVENICNGPNVYQQGRIILENNRMEMENNSGRRIIYGNRMDKSSL